MNNEDEAFGSLPSSPTTAVAASGPREPTTVTNYFTVPAAAQRYASNRPRGHAHVLEVMRRTLAEHLPVTRALDVGCGTGHSTVALLPYARSIEGIDSSSEMLALAPRDARIVYRKGYAEALPCREADFDLVTVSSAYHWFDHERFLREAARVLRPGGWLVLYKAGSTGRPVDRPEYDAWRREVLHVRYPRVARNSEPLTPERAARFAFREVTSETLFHTQIHTVEDYVENLLTHSSLIRVVDGGQEPLDAARAWIRANVAPFFPNGRAEFIHEARLSVLQRSATSPRH